MIGSFKLNSPEQEQNSRSTVLARIHVITGASSARLIRPQADEPGLRDVESEPASALQAAFQFWLPLQRDALRAKDADDLWERSELHDLIDLEGDTKDFFELWH
jgi:hypothetical protein